MNTVIKKTVIFERDIVARLQAVADEKKAALSDVIRDAVQLYLDTNGGRVINPRRLALVNEYNQLALYVLLEKLAPDKLELVSSRADERMAKHHEV